MRGLSDWLAEHEHLKTCWPYDEIETLTNKVLGDGRVDDEEQKMLLAFFTEFLAVVDERTIVSPLALGSEQTLCALRGHSGCDVQRLRFLLYRGVLQVPERRV